MSKVIIKPIILNPTEPLETRFPKHGKFFTKRSGKDLLVFEEGNDVPVAVYENYELSMVPVDLASLPHYAELSTAITGVTTDAVIGSGTAVTTSAAVAGTAAAATGTGLSTMAMVGLGGLGVTGAAAVAYNQLKAPDATTPDTTAPAITSSSITSDKDENSGAGQLIYTATATDTAAITYRLKSGSDTGLSINSTTGAVTLTDNPDYETKSTYNFTVVATDSANNASEQAVTLAINNLDEVAPTITSGTTGAINENAATSTVIYTLNATDTADTSAGVTYSLSGADAALLNLDTTTGEVTLKTSADYETKNTYSFTVGADDGVNTPTTKDVVVDVNNLDEVAPIITSNTTATIINENSGAGQVIYTATSTDTADIAIASTSYSLKNTDDYNLLTINSATGDVALIANPDYETKPSYTFTVIATDSENNASEQTISLIINNLDELAPIITSLATATAINENSGTGQLIYTAISTDTADMATGLTTYSLSGADALLLNINSTTGAVTLIANPDYEAKSSYSFTVVATDNANNASEQTVTLAINNIDEVAPTITTGTSGTVDENAVTSTVIYTLSAIDTADISSGIMYSLSGTDAGLLNLDTSTGEVTLKIHADYETQTSYSFTVIADDGVTTPTTKAVVLNVNNLDEVAPLITSSTTASTINENSGAGQVIYTITSTDLDDIATGSTSYSLKNTGDTSLLTINSTTGEVILIDNPNYETKNNYTFTIIATDTAHNTSEKAVTLAINNLDESAPTITSGTIGAINENAATSTVIYTLNATDTADTSAGVTYSLSGADAALLNLNTTTGEVTLKTSSDYEIKSNYSFTVVASDGINTPSTKAVVVNVNNLDEIAPTATLTLSDSALKIGETSTLTILFSEPVSGFNNSDLIIDNGTLTAVTSNDGGTTWTATYTPTTNIEDTTNVISLSGTYIDHAGNTGTVAQSANYVIDTLPPAVAITSSSLTNDPTPVISGTAEEGTTVTAVIAGATYTTTATSGVWSVDTGSAVPISGTLAINGPGGSNSISVTAVDAAGNPSASAATQTLIIIIPAINLSTIEAGVGGFVINGKSLSDDSGFSVSNAGDVNGDGLDDLIVGAPFVDSSGSIDTGKSYVVFGQTTGTAINLSAVETGVGGFVMNGQNAGDYTGYSVSGAGDVNGDGLDDLIVGAYGGIGNAGKSYVVFGKSSTTAINLSDVELGIGGFLVYTANNNYRSGFSVSGAGDVNGDGLDDLIIGAPGADAYGYGKSYVVFGKNTTSEVNLTEIEAGNGGFTISGLSTVNHSGNSVSNAGDVNGDGFDDLIVGALWLGGAGSKSYVIFGQSTSAAINLSSIEAGNGGFVIIGLIGSDLLEYNVSNAGDVNGDGLDDLILGAELSYIASSGGWYVGKSYVVFGKTDTTPIDVTSIIAGSGGFVINGQSAGDYAGHSISSAGDVNGDGLDDLIVGTYGSGSAGKSYVVFGKTTGTGINLSIIEAGIGGFIINGQNASDYSGGSVSSAGDVNGDGFADLIVGATGADPAGQYEAGKSYVIFGGASNYTSSIVDFLGDTTANTLTGTGANEQFVAGAGNDILIGNGGKDVMYGGAGNDTFILNASNVSALSDNNNTSSNIMRIDGGNGTDTLTLDGNGITLDFSTIQGTKVTGIEVIDITGNGNNSLKFTYTDLLHISDTNILTIKGDAGDSVSILGATSIATETVLGIQYNTYNFGGSLASDVWVQSNVSVITA